VSRAIKVRYLIASVIDEQGESRRGAHELGSLVGMSGSRWLNEDAAVPRARVTDETVPTKPRTVRVTRSDRNVRGGDGHGTGFVVPAGSVMSGVTKEPWATPGVATPAIEADAERRAFATDELDLG